MTDPGAPSRRGSSFRTTLWSVIGRAGSADAEIRRRALETLCATYWPPLYAWLRRDKKSRADAEDLVQGFFARLLESADFVGLDPKSTRFRSYLLRGLRNHMLNERTATFAARRGGGRPVFALDTAHAEAALALSADGDDNDALFDQDWARTLIHGVLTELERTEIVRGRGAHYHALKQLLSAPVDDGTLERLAAEFQTSRTAVKVALHRLRRRFGEMVRATIAQTVRDPDEIEDELAVLAKALHRPSSKKTPGKWVTDALGFCLSE